MLIKDIQIHKRVKYKIYKAHGVILYEVEGGLLANPFVRRTRDKKYMAITKLNRYVTIIFNYENGVVDVITAYPSSNWQIKLFKRRGGK